MNFSEHLGHLEKAGLANRLPVVTHEWNKIM